MTDFRGARDSSDELSQVDWEWLARIAEIDGHALFVEAPPIRRRWRYGLYVKAAAGVLCISVLTIAALLVLP